MASGVAFVPPDYDEFRMICIKYHGNVRAISAHLNVMPITLYSYFKRDPKGKQIVDEIRGYNTLTDLDLAEHVNRYNMSQYKENPNTAQRAAEFTLGYKGKERGWIKEDSRNVALNEENIESTLKDINENGYLLEKIELYEKKYGKLDTNLAEDRIDTSNYDYEPETATEYLSGKQEN